MRALKTDTHCHFDRSIEEFLERVDTQTDLGM